MKRELMLLQHLAPLQNLFFRHSDPTLGLPKPVAALSVEQWRTLSAAGTLAALTLVMGIVCGAS